MIIECILAILIKNKLLLFLKKSNLHDKEAL